MGLTRILLLKIGYFACAFEELRAWPTERQAKHGKFHGCTEQSQEHKARPSEPLGGVEKRQEGFLGETVLQLGLEKDD